MAGKRSDDATRRLAPQLAPGAENALADPGLARVVAAWPELPAHIRAAVLAQVESGQGRGAGG